MVGEYIFLASGCAAVGVVVTFVVFGICRRLGVEIDQNLWVVAVPLVFALLLNVTLLELYRKYRKKK